MELWNSMVAQIYVKCNDDYTSMLVCKGDVIYFQDVLDVPEITGIQRGVSFVKHELDVDATEIYPDKLKIDDVLKDVYINYCRVGACKGENPNQKHIKACESALALVNRWKTMGGRQ